MNALSVYDDRYIKIKITTYSKKVYTNFRGLNVTDNDIEYEYFTVISIGFLQVFENKYYLQINLFRQLHIYYYHRIFSLLKSVFFYFFCFNIYKLDDSEYNIGIFKSIKISIGTMIKNLEMLQFVLIILKLKNG